MAEERYVTLQEAMDILRLSQRQVQYYVSDGKIRSKKAGRRTMLNASDVERLAEENGADLRKPPQPTVEMLPDTGPLIDYLREKDNQIMLLSRRIGELENQLGQRLLPEDAEELRQQLLESQIRSQHLEDEAQRLREALAQSDANNQRIMQLEAQLHAMQEPQEPEQPMSWWKRIFG